MTDTRHALLIALARGAGDDTRQDLDELEAKYGGQATVVQMVVAAERKRALKQGADALDNRADFAKGNPGDSIRREAFRSAALTLRNFGKALTVEAQREYDRNRRPVNGATA